jgi:hypothetical protein
MDVFNGKFARYYVLAISIAAFGLPLVFMVDEVTEHTHGVFAYPLDDSYIHLAVAKNLLLNNVWGINAQGFASVSSSILFPLLLTAIFKFTGVVTIVPFIVNLITAILFLAVLQRWLIKQDINPSGQLMVMLLCIFLIPLPVIVMVGMEHSLHLLFFFLFLTSFTESLQRMLVSPDKRAAIPWPVYVYGILMMTARFESMFLLGAACVILLFHKRWFIAAQLGFICFLPVLIFGVCSILKGSDFLPNSVLIKATVPASNLDNIIYLIREEYFPRFFSSDQSNNTLGAQRLLLLVPIAYLLFFKATKANMSYQYILVMLMVCTIFHIATMSFSFFARYEAYLVGSFTIICGVLVIKYANTILKERSNTLDFVAGLLGVLLLMPLIVRSFNVFNKVSSGAICTYDQQFQMGRFVDNYYNQDPVAINDIGAVSYQSEGTKLDLWGLGTIEVARHMRNQTYTTGFLDSMARKKDIRIAICYENRFSGLVKHWQKIASWYIPYKNDGIYDSVGFYVIKPLEGPLVKDNI